MGIEVTAAIATCDKCSAVEQMTSARIPENWTQARNGTHTSLLCTKCAEELNAFFTPKPTTPAPTTPQ